jgi:hypothetical protein
MNSFDTVAKPTGRVSKWVWLLLVVIVLAFAATVAYSELYKKSARATKATEATPVTQSATQPAAASISQIPVSQDMFEQAAQTYRKATLPFVQFMKAIYDIKTVTGSWCSLVNTQQKGFDFVQQASNAAPTTARAAFWNTGAGTQGPQPLMTGLLLKQALLIDSDTNTGPECVYSFCGADGTAKNALDVLLHDLLNSRLMDCPEVTLAPLDLSEELETLTPAPLD